MSGDFDRHALVSIFAAEASDNLLKIAAALSPQDRTLPSPAVLRNQFIIAHSLTGASSLYGFAGSARLAAVLEEVLDRPGEEPPEEWPETVAMLRDIVDALRTQVETIRRTGVEDASCFDQVKARHPHLLPVLPEPGRPRSAPVTAPPLSEAYFNPALGAEVFKYFIPEAEEYLETITVSLLRLEQEPGDMAITQQLFRAAHTLKGSAYTVGFQAIGDLAHYVEDVVDTIHEGGTRVTPELADILFRAVDALRLVLRREPGTLPQVREEFQVVIGQLQLLSSKPPESLLTSLVSQGPGAEEPRDERSAEVFDWVEEERRRDGAAQEGGEETVVRVGRDRLERLLNLVGELVIGRGRLEQRLDALEQLSRQVLLYKGRMLDAVRSFEEKHAFASPTPIAGEEALSPSAILTSFGSLEFDQYDDLNVFSRRMAEISSDVGESMSQLIGSIRKAREDMGQLQHLTRGLRDEIARTRMVPIGTLFTRFQKSVREMARATGKAVRVSVSGGHTEVDAAVVQRLGDPLIHLVRNAVYHGIEKPSAREVCGKSAIGMVSLHAVLRGNAVAIEVEDDGTGLDLEKIRTTAVARGILRPEQAVGMPASEALKLIYVHGFSTAETVGDQAGRGVGMDAVKQVVERMNGQIEIETEPGVGTKFTLILPVSLLISTALIVRVGDQRYAVPLPSIREVLTPPAGAVQEVGARAVLKVGEEAIEVRPLGRMLGGDPPESDGPAPVVVLRTSRGIIGVTVDELLGRQEIVIKPLGGLNLFQASCYSGATIDPEGRVVLVIDVAHLLDDRRRRPAVPPPSLEPLLMADGHATIRGVGGGREGARILLIDDSLSVRKFVGAMLEGAGYQVETAADGEEGMRKATTEAFQLILTDLELPKVNGYELIQSLRGRPELRSTPILVMTTRAADKHRQMALSLGATAYIAKPVDERTLIREVGHWVSGVAGARA
jgi:chemosensory pili system protein ChpA (sensor histidine kinase/response regulator)